MDRKKIIRILFLLLTTALPFLDAKIIHKNTASYITSSMFGHLGINTNIKHQVKIETLIDNVLKATEYQKMQIAQRAAQLLEADIKEQEKAKKEYYYNAPAIDHTLFIYETQKGYLESFAEKIFKTLPWYLKLWEPLKSSFSTFYSHILLRFKKAELQPFIEKIALDLAFYCRFEQEHILQNYQKTLELFALQDLHQIPDLLCFWNNPYIKNELLMRVKEIDQPIKIQEEIGADILQTEVEEEAAAALANQPADAAATKAGEAAAESVDPTDVLTNMQKAMNESGASSTTTPDDLITQPNKDVNSASDETDETVNLIIGDTGPTGSDLSDLNEDIEPEPEEPSSDPKKPKTKKQLRQEARAERRAERLEKENELLKDPDTPVSKKLLIRARQGLRYILPKRAWDAFYDGYKTVDEAYTTHVYSKIEWMEANPLKRGLDSLPPLTRMIANMMLQMGISAGGGLVVFWIDQGQEAIYAQYAALQAQMANINTRISTEFLSQATQKLKAANIAFKVKRNTISSTHSTLYQVSLAESFYLQAAVASVPEHTNFIIQSEKTKSGLESVMEIDQRFSTSGMLTPDNLNINPFVSGTNLGKWHNVFRVGNWQYLADINGFYQMQLVKIAGTSPLEQAGYALYNSIFREYIPATTPNYKIVVKCTLLNYENNFFMGIIFNNARWISGVPDRYHQHRFAGLYGTNNKIYQVLEESTNATDSKKPNTLWPLYKILTNPKTYTQSATGIEINSVPTTFTITINTSETEASLKISDSSNFEAPALLNRQNLSPQVYTFHGIGFIAAGCTAQFKIIEPQELTYTQEQITEFKNFITTNGEGNG